LDQDPDGIFIRTWLPELSRVDSKWIHTPWLMPEEEQRRCGVLIGQDYPAPLVDHEAAARIARQRIQQVRRTSEARSQSRSIYDRHGSRKRPQPNRRRKSQQPDLFNDGS